MILHNYLKKIILPNPSIQSNGEVSRAFLNENILTFWDTIQFMHQLPYGRTTNRDNYLQIFHEKKGACSTKHALIAALAEELSIPLKLTLAIFLLTENNTPRIASILKRYELESIPEAHCYLKYNNNTLDITFPDSCQILFDAELKEEMTITPQQIGSFKVEKHQEFIKQWIKDKPKLNFDLVWKAREQWIFELSQKEYKNDWH